MKNENSQDKEKEKAVKVKKERRVRASEPKENGGHKRSSAEIFGIFARHNFYIDGFTPKELRTTLEDLGPTYVKIGQIMSGRADILPESYCRELEKLRSDVKPMDAATARAVIEQETGKSIDEIFSEFSDEPLGSASIAQAHFGVLRDGTKVVTKVQRPYVAEQMRSDFIFLKKIASVVNVASETEDGSNLIDLRSVIDELEKVTEEELDFRIEAENTRQFRKNCITDDRVISCPRIIDELTSEKLLTMTYIDGYSIADRARVEREGYDRTAIGRALIESYMHQVLDVRVFHGDPHQGNIMICHGVPYWIDFGMIGRLSEQSVNVIQEMLMSLIQKDIESLTNSVLSLGVITGKVNKTKLMEDVDALIDRYVTIQNLTNIDLGALLTDMKSLLAEYNVTMPGEFTMLMRSLVTLQGVLKEFCPELNLFDFLKRKMLRRMRESFDFKEKALSALESLAATSVRAVKLPEMLLELLRNFSKGRMKVNFELTGYEELLQKFNSTVRNVMLAVFSCVLFMGSCTLCTTNMQPQVKGIPLLALFGFIASISIAIYTIRNMAKKKQ